MRHLGALSSKKKKSRESEQRHRQSKIEQTGIITYLQYRSNSSLVLGIIAVLENSIMFFMMSSKLRKLSSQTRESESEFKKRKTHRAELSEDRKARIETRYNSLVTRKDSRSKK